MHSLHCERKTIEKKSFYVYFTSRLRRPMNSIIVLFPLIFVAILLVLVILLILYIMVTIFIALSSIVGIIWKVGNEKPKKKLPRAYPI